MKIEIIEVLYLLLIAAGSAMIGLLVYLRYLTRRAFRVILLLVEKNEACDYDLNVFLPEAATLLKDIQIDDIFYTITYAGTHLEKTNSTHRTGIKRHHERPGYTVHIGIVPKSARGEQKYISLIVFQTLFLLIEMDVLLRIKAVNEAFHNFSRLQTFILHDVKNVAQFIQTMVFNVTKIKGAQREHTFVEYLRESTPSLALRANKIVGILQIGTGEGNEDTDKVEIKLKTLLENLMQLYQLKGETTGYAVIEEEEYKIVTIFDGIMKNIHEKSLVEPDIRCFVYIRDNEDSVTVLIQDTGSPIEDPGRVFEPFYTTKKTGLGVGLFQTKHFLEQLRGSITMTNTDTGVECTVVIPGKKPAET